VKTCQRSFLTFAEAARYARAAAVDMHGDVRVAQRGDGWWVAVLPCSIDVPAALEFDPIGSGLFCDDYEGGPLDEDEWRFETTPWADRSRKARFDAAVKFVYGKPAWKFVKGAPEYDADSELDEIHAEQEDYSDDLARSEEDGWFYADD